MSGSGPAFDALFPRTRWREGYERAEVDAFVQGLRSAQAGAISANELREQRFASARWARAGYDVAAVDAFLEAVADRVSAGGSPDAIPVPGPYAEPPEDAVVSWDFHPLLQLLLILAVVVLLVILTG